jgi:hypothetical protein
MISIFSHLSAISSKSLPHSILKIRGYMSIDILVFIPLMVACSPALSESKAKTILLLTLLSNLICCSVSAVQHVATAFSYHNLSSHITSIYHSQTIMKSFFVCFALLKLYKILLL